jgi:phosphoglycolate phosphatase
VERKRVLIASPKAVLFDLDGTLVHSAPDLQAAANVVCNTRGWEPFDLKTITSFVGNGVPVLVERIFRARGASVKEADYQTAVMDYLEYYNNHSAVFTKPYEGVVKALDWLKGKGVSMAVVTNKPEIATITVLQALELDRYFAAVIGGDTTAQLKPDTAPYLAACTKLGIEPGKTIYIGDSETDGKTAAAVNVPFVLFTGGYRNSRVDEIPNWRVIDKFSQLSAVL